MIAVRNKRLFSQDLPARPLRQLMCTRMVNASSQSQQIIKQTMNLAATSLAHTQSRANQVYKQIPPNPIQKLASIRGMVDRSHSNPTRHEAGTTNAR